MTSGPAEPGAEQAGPLDAGRMSTWLDAAREVLASGGTSDVPCGGCTACCTSSQFVHIAPNEVDTLARIPAELLFPAPRLPAGHVLMGYDEHGCCPMLVEGTCSIYEHRPQTCRSYDCRVFSASGVDLDDPAKAAISERVRRWRFQQTERRDRVAAEAVRAASSFLAEAEPGFNATQRALAAIEIHDRFIAPDGDRVVVPDPHSVRVELRGVRERGRPPG